MRILSRIASGAVATAMLTATASAEGAAPADHGLARVHAGRGFDGTLVAGSTGDCPGGRGSRGSRRSHYLLWLLRRRATVDRPSGIAAQGTDRDGGTKKGGRLGTECRRFQTAGAAARWFPSDDDESNWRTLNRSFLSRS